MTEKYELTDDEIKEAKVGHAAILVDGKPQIWEGDWAVANAATAKVKGLMEAEHKAEIERLREEILEQQKYIHGGK